ncbi:MAG TPA: DMT family transporter [Polyangiaceae bacterium]|nr:DMT family transporter [Polyangiaceae bacterium]
MSTAAASVTRARLAVLGAAVLFSTGGAAIKACSLSGLAVASLRSGIAAIAIALLLPSARRGWTRRTIVVGLAYAGTMILFVTANKLTTAANTIFLQSTAPLYVLLASPWLLGERAKKSDALYMAVLAAGLAMFFVGGRTPDRLAPNPTLGNVLAVLAGVTWGGTVLGLRWLSQPDQRGRTPSNLTGVLAGNVFAFLFCLPLAYPFGAVSAPDALSLVYLGVIQIALSYVLLSGGLSKIPALEGSLLLTVEPVLNPIWAFWMHGEFPGPWAAAGGGLILGATVLRTASGYRSSPHGRPS